MVSGGLADRPIQFDHAHILGQDRRTMRVVLSALCQGWARPGTSPAVSEKGCYVTYDLQTRDWDGNFYDVAMYFIREGRGSKPATVIAGSSRYYAVPIDRIVSLLEESSFIEIQRLDGVLYQHQPVLVARRGTG